MNYIKRKLVEFGEKYGFIPQCKESEGLRSDFLHVDPRIREAAYQAKEEIEDYYMQKEGVIPFHWHHIWIRLNKLPSKLGYATNETKKVLKEIKGVLGEYYRGLGSVNIHENLPELDDGGRLLKYVVKHELFHSVQDVTGSLYEKPKWEIEGEASMFAVDVFEKLDFNRNNEPIAYKPWTTRYIWKWGKKLMTSFREKVKKARDYFSPWELEEE